MKKSIIKSIIFLTLFSSWSANAEVADKAVYGDMLHSIDKAPKAITNSGSIELPCSSCIKLVEINKRLELKMDSEDLGAITFERDDEPYIIHLQRTSSSPLVSSLIFKNGHTECNQSYTEANPIMRNGDMLSGCLMSHTILEEQKIQLNFKNLPAPKIGENQIIEIRLTKPRVNEREYGLEAEVVKGDSAKKIKLEKDKKFWSNGYNLNFSTLEDKR